MEDATENGDFHGKKLGKHGDNIWFHGDLGDEIGVLWLEMIFKNQGNILGIIMIILGFDGQEMDILYKKGDKFEIDMFEAKRQNAGICGTCPKKMQHGQSCRLAGV